MAKTVFINSQIFTKDSDFVIGGFETEKIQGFSYTDFYFAFRDRASHFLKKYIDEACSLYSIQGKENPMDEAIMSASRVIYDNLKITPEFFSEEFLLEAILNSDSAQKWLFDIKFNIKQYEFQTFSEFNSIPNIANGMSNTSDEYIHLKSLVTETDFVTFIEELSTIES